MSIKLALATANAMVGAEATQAGTNAKLEVFAGSRPTNPDTAISGQTLLATLIAPSWGAASAGSSASATITSVTAAATGTATWFRLYKSDGTTSVLDGDVTATGGGGDLTFDNVSFVSGGTVNVTSFNLTETAD